MNRFRYKRAAQRLRQRQSEDLSRSRSAELDAKLSHIDAKLSHIGDEVASIRQLVGPFAVTFPDGSMLCQSIHGVKYFVDPDDLVITPQMVIYRQWEAELSRLFGTICTPDTVLVDVGANFGYFTCLGGSLIGASGRGRVFAFEPNPKLVALLRRNVEINWSMAPVEIHPVAVANFTGTANLLVPDNKAANATLSARVNGKAGESIATDVVRLDDVLPRTLEVDILKIDVEGHEFNVLLGAEMVIARSPGIRIVMEWSKWQMRDARVDPRKIVDLLKGFSCYNADAPDPYAETYDPEWLLDQPYVNALLQRD